MSMDHLSRQEHHVCILVPLYNCAPYLEQCLDSLLNQTYQNTSIIISDDCSTDDSYRIAMEYANTHPRIKVYHQATNIGYLKNSNFLYSVASGDYLAIQDSDDWAELSRIEKQVHILDNKPEIALVGTSVSFHYEDRTNIPPVEKDRLIDGIKEDFASVPASIMFRAALLNKTEGFNPYFDGGTSMDRYFIMELLEGEQAWHIGVPLYNARVLASSNHRTFSMKKIITGELFNKLLLQRMTAGTDWLKERKFTEIEAWEKELVKNKRLMSEKYREYAVYQVDGGAFRLAWTYLYKAVVLNPVSTLNYRTLFYLLRKRKANSTKPDKA